MLSLHVKNFCIMKNRLFVFVMLAAAVAGLVSCNCGQKQPSQYAVTVEPLVGTDAQIQLYEDEPVALWDDNMEVIVAHLEKGEDGVVIVRDDTAATTGVLRVVYHSSDPFAEAGYVDICQHQSALETGAGMVYYGETTEDAADEVALKAVCGVIRLHLVTAEKLAKVEISTADSNRYMTGKFEVSNYPFPVLTATERSVRSVELDALWPKDFTEGADVYCYIAPGCYNTFTIVMTTTDGRTCTKSLKEGKEVVVDRNRVCTINMASQEEALVFE